MNSISVFGLGYVGCVSAACLASRGHRVVGVDVNPDKMSALRQGTSPIVEAEIGDLTAAVVAAGNLVVTSDAHEAVLATDVSLICVGTPSAAGGALLTRYLEEVTAEIGAALRDKDGWHVVVYRSTMVPGTCEGLLIPLLEDASGKRAGVDFGVCVNRSSCERGPACATSWIRPKLLSGVLIHAASRRCSGSTRGCPGRASRWPSRSPR